MCWTLEKTPTSARRSTYAQLLNEETLLFSRLIEVLKKNARDAEVSALRNSTDSIGVRGVRFYLVRIRGVTICEGRGGSVPLSY